METNQAAEHLQVIRTLMERSALYRRALAPIMIFAGATGIAAAAVGIVLGIEAQRGFVGYWMSVALVGLVGAFMLVRRQALKIGETFWSPPTRRVGQALMPSFTAGLLVGIIVMLLSNLTLDSESDAGELFWLPAIWAVFYGCGLHAAGFFTSRGLRLFGWALLLTGNAVFLSFVFLNSPKFPSPSPEFRWQSCHVEMGVLFGVLQVAYGIYLYFTEKRGNEL